MSEIRERLEEIHQLSSGFLSADIKNEIHEEATKALALLEDEPAEAEGERERGIVAEACRRESSRLRALTNSPKRTLHFTRAERSQLREEARILDAYADSLRTQEAEPVGETKCSCLPWSPGVYSPNCPVDSHRAEFSRRLPQPPIGQPQRGESDG